MSDFTTAGVSRRQFVKVATAATAIFAGGRTVFGRTLREAADEAPLYAFPLLGDIHYDKMSHHDLDWVRKEKPGDEKQMIGYSSVTEKYTPALFDEVVAAIKTAGVTVPFAIQVGDVVEGLCGSKELQVTQFKEAFGFVEGKQLGVPFVTCKGNHDITGPGAEEAFNDTLIPWVAKQAKQDIQRSHYTLQQGDDLFVFFDCYKPDMKWLEQTLSTKKARQVFFIVHQPVVPYNARANWICFGREEQKDQRAKLVSLLGQYKAIVLSGHLHKYSVLTRTDPAGAFRQLAVCSVARRNPEAPKEPRDVYDATLLDLEPKHDPKSIDWRKQLIENDKPLVTDFDYADAPGYAMVKVYKDRIDTDVYMLGGKEQWKKPGLAKLS